MKSKATRLVALCLFSVVTAFGQGQGQPQPPTGRAADTVAPNIPGVVAAGTKVQFIKDGFNGTEGPITLPDGSVIFTETNANRLTKIDKDGNTSSFLENIGGANGLGFDSKGRLFAVQTLPGKTGIAVLYPKGSETWITDNFDGKPYGRPNDLVVYKKGGVYFTDPGPNAPAGGGAPPKPPQRLDDFAKPLEAVAVDQLHQGSAHKSHRS